MKGITITLFNNKQYSVTNENDVIPLEDESNATSIEVHFPEEYLNYSKRVDFMNPKREKWTTPLYMPEDERNKYDESFDKLNFSFTIPNAMAIRGELKMQFVAYKPDDSNAVVPFKIVLLRIEESILYATIEGTENPEILIKAYEYSNLALEIARDANEKTANAERASLEAEASAKNAENSAKSAQTSATNAQNSAKSAQTSATNAQNSAKSAQDSASSADARAKSAEQQSANAVSTANSANTKSNNAVSTSNTANATANKTLEIVDNLTVSNETIDCEGDVDIQIQTNSTTKHKNIHFKIPAPKKGTSYRYQGIWSASANYINDQYFIDTVFYEGCTYFCKVSNTNQKPIPSESSDYWGLLAIKGSDAGVVIIDNLESDRSDYVLSAKQGKVLKELTCNIIQKKSDGSQETINTIVLQEV